jgi:exodeoxyribonuclease VII small subunit
MAKNAASEKDKIPEDIASLSFEQSLQALEEIVRKLESGQTALEDSINDYTRGTALKLHCMNKLSDARLRVEKMIQQSDGSVTTEPFAAE